MKVQHVIASTGVGGAEKHLLDLCEQQQKSGLAVQVLVPSEGALTVALRRQAIPYATIVTGARLNPFALFSLRQAIRRYQPDIIHAHMLKSAWMVGHAVRNVPCVATAHNMVKRLAPFRHCQHVICVSEMVREGLIGTGYPAASTTNIHNAVDVDVFRPSPSREATRQKLGWQDRFVVLTVARLVTAKGQKYAIRALAELIPSIPNLLLVLVGDGPEHGALSRLADVLKVSGHLSFLGSRTDVSDLLAAADAYLQPSIKEGFCIAFLEAMSSGLPCIGTCTGAIPEMVTDSVNGLLIPPADSHAIVGAVSRVALNAAFRAGIAHHAAETARRDFGLDKQARDTQHVYQRVLAGVAA